MRYYLAIDIGASSGRHIVGWRKDGEIRTKEVYRFPNGVETVDGHLTWNIRSLLTQVKEGIQRAKTEFPDIYSLSIDTWGVDYVLLRGEQEVFPCYAYRDKLGPKHFRKWVDFCKERDLCCDFNSTFFSHPKANGLTLSSPDEDIRRFWIAHGKACIRISNYLAEELRQTCVIL